MADSDNTKQPQGQAEISQTEPTKSKVRVVTVHFNDLKDFLAREQLTPLGLRHPDLGSWDLEHPEEGWKKPEE